MSVFKKALLSNSPKKIYFHLLDLYAKDNNYKMLLDLVKSMMKKHKGSKKCSLYYLKVIVQLANIQEENKEVASLIKNITLKSELQRIL